MLLRCPLCGNRWSRRGWLSLAPQCGRCDLYLERRENDFFLGGYTVNLLGTLTLAMIGSWAMGQRIDAPAWQRDVVVIAAVVAFALVFYPFSKLLWLATDLVFRPPLEKDFDEEAEPQ